MPKVFLTFLHRIAGCKPENCGWRSLPLLLQSVSEVTTIQPPKSCFVLGLDRICTRPKLILPFEIALIGGLQSSVTSPVRAIRSLRHPYCLSHCVQFYDVLDDGYHTALTRTQVADLFHAGRIGRNTPCKRLENTAWRTVDELFPLFKHESVGYRAQLNESREGRRTAVVGVLVALPLLALIGYMTLQALRPSANPLNLSRVGAAISGASLVNAGKAAPIAASMPVRTASYSTVQTYASVSPRSTAVSLPNREMLQPQTPAPTQAQRGAEQWERQQILAQRVEQQTRAAQFAQEQQKAAGRNVVVPLDQWTAVNVGGVSVNLKIHDNDVSTFDVWVNGTRRHEVKKEKGISGTGADETLIYTSGSASLYYVWEISGKLNHCLLRVRES